MADYTDESGYSFTSVSWTAGDATTATKLMHMGTVTPVFIRNTKGILGAQQTAGDPNPGSVADPMTNCGYTFFAWRSFDDGDTQTIVNVSDYRGVADAYFSGSSSPKGFNQRVVRISLRCLQVVAGNIEDYSPGSTTGFGDNWMYSGSPSAATEWFFPGGAELGTGKAALAAGDSTFEFWVTTDGDLKCKYTDTGSGFNNSVAVVMIIDASPIIPTS